MLKVAFIFFMAFICATLMADDVDTAWVRTYDGGSNDFSVAVAVDDSGYIYVACNSVHSGTIKHDYLTMKYNPDGDTVWTRRYNWSLDNDHFIRDMAIDQNSNVYVTGKIDTSTSYTDEVYATLKYDSSGVLKWDRFYDYQPYSWDGARAIAVD